jgi:ring-1,2-phenylacetyl-CoA epoxidase subunit PaaD
MHQPALPHHDTTHGSITAAPSAPSEEAVWAVLRDIADPELPALSVVELGVIRHVRWEDGSLVVELMPTFLGCPALDLMREEIAARVGVLAPTRVEVVRDEPWTTARITDAGRRKLRAAGIAPPPRGDVLELPVLPVAACPYCGARATTLESPFGPTPCRAIAYCRACRQPFEQFKPA